MPGPGLALLGRHCYGLSFFLKKAPDVLNSHYEHNDVDILTVTRHYVDRSQ